MPAKTNAYVNGVPHSLVILQITGRDEKGRIASANILHDDMTVDLSDETQSREFVTALVKTDVLKGVTVN